MTSATTASSLRTSSRSVRRMRHRASSRRRRRSASGTDARWIHQGDLAAEIVVYTILALGVGSFGLAAADSRRLLAWALCGLLGVWACVGLWLGRWSARRLASLRWVGVAGLVLVIWTGVQMLPVPRELVTALSGAWREAMAANAAAGVPLPDKLTMAHNPEGAPQAWAQAVASLGFLGGVCMVLLRRGAATRMVGALILLCSLEGLLGLFTFLTGLREGQMSGIVFNSNHHAVLTVMGIPVLFAGIAHLRRTNPQFMEPVFSGSNPLLVLVALGFVSFASYVLSSSRTIVVGTGLLVFWGIFETYLWFRERFIDKQFRQPPRSLTWGVWIGTVAVVVLAVWALGSLSAIASNLLNLDWSVDRKGAGRLELWRATVLALQANPLLGLGLTGTEDALGRYVSHPMWRTPIWSHNDWLQIVAELGIPATLVCCGFLSKGLWAFGQMARERRRAWTALGGVLQRGCMVGLALSLLQAIVDFHLRIPTIGFATLILVAFCLSQVPLHIAEQPSRMRERPDSPT